MSALEWREHGRGKVGRRSELLEGGERTGMWVIHCGHPTALWPWYVASDDPLPPDATTFHGTFRLLARAKEVALALHQGELVHVGGFYRTPGELEGELP